MDSASRQMPVAVGVRLAHAAVQAIADEHGIDVLHIKGPAVHPSLVRHRPVEGDSGSEMMPVARRSSDADVWVRPSQASRLLRVMVGHRWKVELPFQDDSTFEHAAMLTHPVLAPVDVHRRFPGIRLEPEAAFELLWESREQGWIAHYPCMVPGVVSQRVILLVNAARGKLTGNDDIHMCWEQATEVERSQVDALAELLGAEVPLAASTGRLDDYRGRPEHDLWALLSTGTGTSAALWWARVRAQPTLAEAVRMGFKQVFPSPRRIRAASRQDLSRLGLFREYAHRARVGLGELKGMATARLGGKR